MCGIYAGCATTARTLLTGWTDHCSVEWCRMGWRLANALHVSAYQAVGEGLRKAICGLGSVQVLLRQTQLCGRDSGRENALLQESDV